jgi:hypothetical protein
MITLHQFQKVSNTHTHYLERKFIINLSTTMRNFQINATMLQEKKYDMMPYTVQNTKVTPILL